MTFYIQKNNNADPSSSELRILEMLLIDFNMNPGVVNVLIDYVLRINNNKLVKQFVESIASQWVRSNIETVEQAMKLAEKEYKNKKQIEKTTKKVEFVNEPEWFNKNIKEKETTIEEQQSFEEKLKELRGEA